MPSGVIFIIYIPSNNFEQTLRFGPQNNVNSIRDQPNKLNNIHVNLLDRKSKSIPIHLTQQYYNEAFNALESINEVIDFVAMEHIMQELLLKLQVEHDVWTSDKAGKFFEIVFPLPTGDRCETMLHCLTQLGIGVKYKSLVSVIPCSVVYSATNDNVFEDEETILFKTEDEKRWRNFVESIKSKLTVKQVVDGVRGGGELSFDYLVLIITADSLAALGLVENNASNIVAAMLVSPLMGPVMSITFGTIIADRSLVKSGIESLIMGMICSLLFGFIFGLILGTTEMPWGFGDWPTEEMKSRSLWMGVLWALTSGTGVALALLQGSAGPLIGIAISASLLPPVVNCGLFWALSCICLLYPGTKIPHLKGETYYGNSSYQPLYHDYIPIEFAINGIVSCCLTIVNVVCIFLTAIIFLKIKEVAAPYTSSPDLQRFWGQDIKVTRDANRANLQRAEEEERSELVLDDLDQANDEEVLGKLEAIVQEAIDDETYRKVKRMSYQSHVADEVVRTIGLQSRSPASARSSEIYSDVPTPVQAKGNIHDIEMLDKILTSLLGLKDNKRRPFRSHRATPRVSRILRNNELLNGSSESWPDKIFEDSIVRSVVNNLKSKKSNSSEEPYLTPK